MSVYVKPYLSEADILNQVFNSGSINTHYESSADILNAVYNESSKSLNINIEGLIIADYTLPVSGSITISEPVEYARPERSASDFVPLIAPVPLLVCPMHCIVHEKRSP